MAKNNPTDCVVQNGVVHEETVKRLEEEIAKQVCCVFELGLFFSHIWLCIVQGALVRRLKESDKGKSVWQPEVNKLLELKAKLKIAGESCSRNSQQATKKF